MTLFNNNSRKNVQLLVYGALAFIVATLIGIAVDHIAYASFMFTFAVFLALRVELLEVRDQVEELKDKLEAKKP